MAWNIHWQIAFQSILGTNYELNILDEDYSGEVVSLTGAANPIETQEDKSENVFTPIRGGSGNIHIVTNDNTLLSQLMPTENMQRRVELKQGNTVKWRGYIPVSAYTQPNTTEMTEISIPIRSILSSLDVVDFSGYYGQFITIGDAINTIFSKVGITLGTDAYMWFQTEMYDFTEYMKSLICASLFYELETKVNNNVREQIVVANSCKKVLESILKVMGWSITEYDGNFYVTNNVKNFDTTNLVHSKRYNFQTKSVDQTGTTGVRNISSYDQYISDNQPKITVKPGVKQVEVVTQIADDAAIDSGDPETPYSENAVYGGTKLQDGEPDGVIYMQPIDNPTNQRRQLWTERFYRYYQAFYNRVAASQRWFTDESATLLELAGSSAYRVDTLGHITDTPEVQGQSGVIGACLCRADEGATKEQLTLQPGLLINMNCAYRMAKYYGTTGSPVPVYSNDLVYELTTNDVYTFKSGYIYLAMDYKVIEYYKRGYAAGVGPHVKVFIGNTEISAGGDTGYHITEEMTGRLKVSIYGGDTYPFGNPRTILITSLRLYWSVNNSDIIASHDSENKYIEILNRNYSGVNSISQTIGTNNNNKASMSILLNPYMVAIEKFNMYDQNPLRNLRPEMYVLQAMANQYSQSQNILTRTYRNIWNVVPFVPFTADGLTYIAVRDKIRWADDNVTIKYIQIYKPNS